jgi:osmoprotectant transport system substrate-binding protein
MKHTFLRSLILCTLLLVVVACGGGTGTTTSATSPADTDSGAATTAPVDPATEATAPMEMTTEATAPMEMTAEATASMDMTAEATAPMDMTAEATTEATTGTDATAGATSGATTGGPRSGDPIRIGSKNFTEEFILGELYAQILEANGFTVERKFNLGATPIAHQALLSDEIDLYPEYTSTGLLEVLKQEPQTDREAIFNTVKSEYESQFQLTWLEPSPFNNTNTFAMTQAKSDELGIKTYSDLAAKADQVVLGGPPEFIDRADTQALFETYGGFPFKEVRQLDPGVRYQALQDGDIDVVVAFGTDGQIGGYDLVALQDDKNFYPPYQVAPVIRQDTLSENPDIEAILNSVSPLLDDQTMADLNWMVDGPDKMEPADVARQFLTEQGLLQ